MLNGVNELGFCSSLLVLDLLVLRSFIHQ